MIAGDSGIHQTDSGSVSRRTRHRNCTVEKGPRNAHPSACRATAVARRLHFRGSSVHHLLLRMWFRKWPASPACRRCTVWTALLSTLVIGLVAALAPCTASAQSGNADSKSAAPTITGVSEETTTKGTAYVSEVHAARTSSGERVPVRGRAVYNGQVGYTAFALELQEPLFEGEDASSTVRIVADGRSWRVRRRNVSVRDTALVLVLNRRPFARIAEAQRSHLEIASKTIELPVALRRQMRAIEAVCTREPVGCQRQ